MCGIVGYITKEDKAYKDAKQHFMRFALALDTLRGSDSTGVMTVSKNFKVQTMRSLMPGDAWVHSKSFRSKWNPGWASFGHNRAATAGKVTIGNAHPFEVGPISLVHNGTLWRKGDSLPKVGKDIEVDSHQIAYNLAEHPVAEAKSVIEKIDGSYALVWYDSRDMSINIARNSERPLHFTVNTQRDAVWFMSDGSMLKTINKSMSGHSAAGHTIWSLDRGRLLKFRKGNVVPEVTNFVPFVPFTPAMPGSGTGKSQTRERKEKSHYDLKKHRGKEATEQSEKSSTYGPAKSSAGSGKGPQVLIAGRRRLVPHNHVRTLLEEYELTSSDTLRFKPEQVFELGNNEYTVVGVFNHPLWDDSEWIAEVRGANSLQIKAYLKSFWAVRPVGVGLPWDEDEEWGAPSAICTLIHCNWQHHEDREKESLGKAEAQLPDDTEILGGGMIVGPENVLVNFATIRAAYEAGCISCGGNLRINRLQECIYVNESRDILCRECQTDYGQNYPIH